MFQGLSDKLISVFEKIRGVGKLTEKDVDAALNEVKMALLEADVNFKVVKNFIKRIKERALGAEILKSLTPGQQVIKIVHEELVVLLGNEREKINLSSKKPTVILMAGLQGSGKTTTSAKLALNLRKEEKKKSKGKKKGDKKKEDEKAKKEEEEKKKKENEVKDKNKNKKSEDKNKKPEDKNKPEGKNKTEDKNKKGDLKNEKDFIDLAKKNAEKVKAAKPLPIFTLSYLQNLVELLGPTLDLNQVNELLKKCNNIFNKKLNEGEKKKVSTKVNIKVGKINDRNDKLGEYDDDIEEEEEEEEQEEHEDIDKYI